MNMFEFFHQHWFMSLIFMVVVIPTIAFFTTSILLNILKTINILVKGWPPPHLDAEGNFQEHIEEEDQTEDNNGS
jgi:hypothetical protein